MITRPPIEVVQEILGRAPLVGLGEIHWCPAVLEAITTLVESPALAGQFDDIVVEFGSARHQALLDRYISGEEMGGITIDVVWEDALHFLLWSPPVYARFFARIRAMNLQRPARQRVRVLLAEPALDWSSPDSDAFQELHHAREQVYVECIEQEVLSRDRRALLIFGVRHLARHASDDNGFSPLAERLLKRQPGVIEVIHPYHEEKAVYSGNRPPRHVRHNGGMVLARASNGNAEPIVDYIWHLGSLVRQVMLPDSLFEDPAWLAMTATRLQRLGNRHIARAYLLMTPRQQSILGTYLGTRQQ